jgi:Leucyl aminopeptidase
VDYDWAHIDIAGVAWAEGANKGATGRPMGLMSEFLINESNT